MSNTGSSTSNPATSGAGKEAAPAPASGTPAATTGRGGWATTTDEVFTTSFSTSDPGGAPSSFQNTSGRTYEPATTDSEVNVPPVVCDCNRETGGAKDGKGGDRDGSSGST